MERKQITPSQYLVLSDIYDLMIVLARKTQSSVHATIDGQRVMTSIPDAKQEPEGTISKCVGDDPNDPRSWKTFMYF